ncbi:hypothetical protein PM082_021125 [Marasmius tenuissimus]|nr:hypothetical protein PM082_021125 [Marasmius tenuissimus]
MSTTASTSFQLPDLLSLTREFDLRANKRCHTALEESEEWLTGLNDTAGTRVFTQGEIERIHGQKMGLLAALGLPTCDTPQLRLVADFLGLLVIANERVKRGNGDATDWAEIGGFINEVDFVGLLESHSLLKCLQPRISRLRQTTPSHWQRRFKSSILTLRDAQLRVKKYRDTIPELDEYLEFARDLSGLRVVFNLLESAEGLDFNLSGKDAEDLNRLRRLAAEFIAISFDVFSFNNDQAARCQLNLVQLLISQQGLSIQGAVNLAGTMASERIQAFTTLEAELWARHSPPSESPAEPSTWFSTIMGYFYPAPPARSPSIVEEWDTGTSNDVSLFMQGLKDCMVGSLNWAFESEMFFGQKGAAIRSFGWVFLLPPEGSATP